jgi:leader peptidase (prepilin peptidase)/N-methyltransferase
MRCEINSFESFMRFEIVWTALMLVLAGVIFKNLTSYWMEEVCEQQVKPRIYYTFAVLCILAAFVVNALCDNVLDRMLLLAYLVLLIMLSLIDSETTYIPDALVMPMMAIGILGNACGSYYNSDIFKLGTFSIVSAACGYGVLWLVNLLYKICAKGRDGIGMGDAKLMAAICSVMGISAMPFVSFAAACSFLMNHAIVCAVKNKPHAQEQAFGPHLAVGACVYLYGDFVSWPGNFNTVLLKLFHL